MAEKKTAPASEADATAALQTIRAFLDDKASHKAAVVAGKTLNRYIRECERDVAAEKRRLKDEGINVDKEIRKMRKGGAA